ncbi:NAC domain-containing protein 45 [Linum grandiflorum]
MGLGLVSWRFHPKKYELVTGYLLNKLRGLPLPCSSVQDCDLYGELEPWDIWSMYNGDEDGELYFFTALKKKNQRFKRFERSVGTRGATWHEEGKGRPDESYDGKVKWEWTKFKYLTKESSEKKRKRKRLSGEQDTTTCTGSSSLTEGWLLEEFKLTDHPYEELDPTAVNSLVVCRLRRKVDKKNQIKKPIPNYLGDQKAIVECPVVVEEVLMNSRSDATVQDQNVAVESSSGATVQYQNVAVESSSGSTVQDQNVAVESSSDDLLSEDFRFYYTLGAGSSSSSSITDVIVAPLEEETTQALELDDDFFNSLGDFQELLEG